MGELAGIGDRGAALEAQPEVTAVIAGDAGLGSVIEDLGYTEAQVRKMVSGNAAKLVGL